MRIAATAVAAVLAASCTPAPAPAPTTATSPTTATAPTTAHSPAPTWTPAPTQIPPERPAHIRWIAFGGVDGPAINELSIEDELIAVSVRLGPGGVVLYAGGPGSHGVRVADPAARSPRGDALLGTLGDLLAPRGARDSHYRPLRLLPHAAGTHAALMQTLSEALAQPGGRLQIWIAGHGSPGTIPADVVLSTWGGEVLLVSELQEALTGPRPLRIIQTTCFGGGFAEAVIAHADRACGLFATTWDLEASGCDPDPERARESYGALLLRAIEAGEGDLDGDGGVGLAEAHVRATTSAPGFEVPILSSQFLLWHTYEHARGSPAQGPPEQDWLAEERAILGALLPSLGIDAAELEAHFETLKTEHDELSLLAEDAANKADEARNLAQMAVLARWPMLDDPWHPDFWHVFDSERAAIESFFATSSAILDAQESVASSESAWVEVDRIKVRLAPVDRAIVAQRTLARAAFVKTTPEAAQTWATFQLLRQCEREAL